MMFRWLHNLTCVAVQFRSANGTVTMGSGTITVASCKHCGLARAYDRAGVVHAGDLLALDYGERRRA